MFWSEVGGQLLNCVSAKIAKHKPCTICTRDGHGRRRTARGPAGLGRFFFTGVAEEHWDVYPHLDEITAIGQIDLICCRRLGAAAALGMHELTSSFRSEFRTSTASFTCFFCLIAASEILDHIVVGGSTHIVPPRIPFAGCIAAQSVSLCSTSGVRPPGPVVCFGQCSATQSCHRAGTRVWHPSGPPSPLQGFLFIQIEFE